MNEVPAALHSFIMDWLDPVGVVVGLVVAFPVFWTWYEVVFGQRRRQRRWYQEVRRRSGERPAILIVDLLPEKDIRAGVQRYCSGREALKDVPTDRIIRVARDHRLRPDDMPGLYADIRKAAGTLIATGADVIHFFYAGPTVVAALVGAELANSARVLVYQHGQEGYECFGPLRWER